MKSYIYIISMLFLFIGNIQSIGGWKSYLPYAETTLVAEGNNSVFAVANGSLYSYGKDDNSITYHSKETGLSDINITSIAFNAQENALVIAYSNGNIDVWGDTGIRNYPYLMNMTNIQDKNINSIYNYNEYAYLCANFGIVVMNLDKKEVKETYRLNKVVSSATIYDNYIYAVTPDKVLRCALNTNLIDPNNWQEYTVTVDSEDTVTKICTFQNTLCFLIKNKGMYYLNNGELKSLMGGIINNIKVENDKLLAYNAKDLYIFFSLTEKEKVSSTVLNDASTLKDNTFWLAAGTEGIIGIKRNAANSYEPVFSGVENNSPIRSLNAFMKIYNNKLYIAGGGRWTEPNNSPGTIMKYDLETKKWSNYIANDYPFRDVTSIAVDPADENHFFASSYQRGLYEFKDNEYLIRHNSLNSALTATHYTGSTVRVEGLIYDNDNNLWMTNALTDKTIKILKANGEWDSLYYPDISYADLPDKILITSWGDKWVNLARANKAGIFVFNENNTIDDTSDDQTAFFGTLFDSQGNNINAGEFYCITEDRNKQLWIGTNNGPVIVSSAQNALSNPDNTRFNRIVRTNESGEAVQFLIDERVTAIAVDGGNRKWIGTQTSGIYLASEDGQETLEHFTTDNSPLLSNNIQSIAINDETGEVFIGTEKGLISYMGDATGGSEDYSNVYAFPNPVRPDFDGKVIITGLMENSIVKITDVRGNLIYQTKSTGGQISWDCRNKSGRRVASGVYLVLSATSDSKESVVTKIAVVK